MRERREYVRSNGLVLVNYKIPQLQMEGKSSAFDVCETGVRITTNKKIKNGTLVEMEIYLPGSSQPILAKGKVIWTQICKEKAITRVAPEQDYFYLGVHFTLLGENSKKRIGSYVHRKTYLYKERR